MTRPDELAQICYDYVSLWEVAPQRGLTVQALGPPGRSQTAGCWCLTLNSLPVLLPTYVSACLLHRRPWNGVFLSEEYLSSVEAAESITRELLDVYATAGVLPLLESAVKTDVELRHARGLLGVAV